MQFRESERKKHRLRLYTRLLSSALLLLCLLMPAASAEESGAGGHAPRTVRVGCALSTGYHQKRADGSLTGYGYTYEQVLSQYAGWEIEYVEGSWPELQQLLADGDIDLLGFLVKTQERAALYDFAESSSGESMSCLVVRDDDARFAYQDYEAFNGITVAYQGSNANQSSFLDYAAENGFSVQMIPCDTYQDVFDALDSGAADAALMTNYQDLSGYSVVDQFLSVNFYYAAAPGNDDLLRELNTAISDLSAFYPDFPSYLYEKYYDVRNGRNTIFTREERAYLATQPVVTVVRGGRGMPFEAQDAETGEYQGIVPDLLAELSRITGIRFEYEPSANRELLSQGALSGNVVTALTCDIEWAQKINLRITQPFIEGGISIVSRKNVSEIQSVAMMTEHYLNDLLSTEHPEWTVQSFDSMADCLDAVRSGKCDATLMNGYEADYYLGYARYANLTENTYSGVQQNICLGITAASDPELHGILSKALLKIPTETMNAIIRKHIAFQDHASLEELIYANPLQAIVISVSAALLLLVTVGMVLYVFSMRRKNREITAATQAKSEFLSRMSHDIRTPMNTIVNLTRIVEEELDDREAALQDLKKIESSNRFLLSLVNDVLDMSKIEDGRMELHPERYGYAEFTGYLRSTFDPMSVEKQITLKFESDAQGRDILVDKLRFNQLCFNLLSNAIKYTPPGGHVTFKMTHGEVQSGKLPCEIFVIDDGIGMSAEFQRHMFEPFSQEGRAYRAVEGTGLGLPIVRKIVELLGGSIDVQSETGKGTCMRVVLELALAPDEVPAEKPAEAGRPETLRGRRILVAEDHPLNQEIARKLLERVGARAVLVGDGQEAVNAFREHPGEYDAILMDLRMPRMDGLEATHRIRASKIRESAGIPIIAMTANAYTEDVRSCLEAGMNAHLSKPVEPQKLYDTLAQYISEYRRAG